MIPAVAATSAAKLLSFTSMPSPNLSILNPVSNILITEDDEYYNFEDITSDFE